MTADPRLLSLGCACFVPETAQNIHLPLSKKKPSGLPKRLGFLVNVPFWSALDVTLNQRGPAFESPAAHKALFKIESMSVRTLDGMNLTVPQLFSAMSTA